MLLPLGLLVVSKVALESLLAPGAVDRVGNRSKGRNGLVLARVAKELFKLAFVMKSRRGKRDQRM